jgi:hypothetical protein
MGHIARMEPPLISRQPVEFGKSPDYGLGIAIKRFDDLRSLICSLANCLHSA